jgi:hypothetical protein
MGLCWATGARWGFDIGFKKLEGARAFAWMLQGPDDGNKDTLGCARRHPSDRLV